MEMREVREREFRHANALLTELCINLRIRKEEGNELMPDRLLETLEWIGWNLRMAVVPADVITHIEVEAIMKKLHGSGLDCEPELFIRNEGKTEKALKYEIRWSYHCMNEQGYYDGWADFKVVIPRIDPAEFKLHFCGAHSQRQAHKYMLREYLEDVFAQAIADEMMTVNAGVAGKDPAFSEPARKMPSTIA